MLGTGIYARSISARRKCDGFGNPWQYNSRSDAHSRAACWAIMFDLLCHCSLMRCHAEQGVIAFGINHEMHDFRMKRKKNLDLVICKPNSAKPSRKATFSSLAEKHGIALSDHESRTLDTLPELYELPVGTVLVALEAKACMTAHQKAKPRLYDELSSSFQTIHGDTVSAIAAGFISVNVADSFISSVSNRFSLRDKEAIVNSHNQPKDASEVVEKITELQRRSGEDEKGFDALGIVLLDCRNDGSDVKCVTPEDADVEVSKIFRYDTMINRIAHLYSVRYKTL